MMETLRGLHFWALSGTHYYYDDHSGLVFPCPDGLERVLGRMNDGDAQWLKDASDGALSYWERFVGERHRQYGAFWGPEFPRTIPDTANAGDLEYIIRNDGFRQMILTVTGNCNMRCRYCINSECYPYDGEVPSETMSFDVAKAALDYYFDALAAIRKRDPCRTAIVTFYGGEPLLNFSLIEKTVRYVREREVQNTLFTISTNGLLMDDAISDFLVANNFAVWVSLDGPREEHDRNRIFGNERPSFDRVFARVERFWKRHPGYPLLCFLVTYDWKTDMRALEEFFKGRDEFKNTLFIFNQVNPYFTDYYNRFSEDDRRHFREGVNEIKDALRNDTLRYDPVTNFCITSPYRLHLLRRILNTPGRSEIPATSTCLPGEKLCVLPDGRLQPCEKAPGLDVGTVETGLNFEAISELIHRYNQVIVSNCRGCPMLQLCKTCFASFWSGTEFTKPTSSFCGDNVTWATQVLEETYSLFERRPEYYQDIVNLFQRKYGKLLSLEF